MLCVLSMWRLTSIQSKQWANMNSSNMTVTTVPSIRSTRLNGGTSSTQYLVAKQIQNTNCHNLNSTAAILCKSSNCYCNVCASIKVCFRAYGADKIRPNKSCCRVLFTHFPSECISTMTIKLRKALFHIQNSHTSCLNWQWGGGGGRLNVGKPYIRTCTILAVLIYVLLSADLMCSFYRKVSALSRLLRSWSSALN